MESITNTIKGFVSSSGNQPQSGSEPVSGQTGSGTIDQPYDAGNTKGQSGSTGGALGSSDSTVGRQSDNTSSEYSGTTVGAIGSSDSTSERPSGSLSDNSKITAGGSYGAQSNTTDYTSRGVNPFIADLATNKSNTTTGGYSGTGESTQERSVPSGSTIPIRPGNADYATNTSQTGVYSNTTGDATGAQTGTADYVTGSQTGASDDATGPQAGTAGYTSRDKNNQNVESEAQEPLRPQAEVEDPSRSKQSDDIISEQDKKNSSPEDSSETKEHKARGETWTGASWVKFDKVNAGDPEMSSGKELEDQETAAENAKADAGPSVADTHAHKEGMKEKLAGELHIGHHKP